MAPSDSNGDPKTPGAFANRRGRLVAVVGFVAGIVGGTVLPALGIPELYSVTVTSAAGAVSIASFWVLLGAGFDDRGYLSAVRVGRDAVWVIANALLAAALVVTDGVYTFYRCNRARFGR